MEAKIIEKGNGFPRVGDFVSCDGAVYRVTALGRIHPARWPGDHDHMFGEVEPADWSDVTDETEPKCTCSFGA